MKFLFEERGGTYTEVRPVLLPNLVLDPQPEGEIGIWGWRRKEFLRKNRKGIYNAMMMNGTLTQHLIDANEAAMEMMDSLVSRMVESEGVTEDLKRKIPWHGSGAMNNIRNRANEIVRNDLIEQ